MRLKTKNRIWLTLLVVCSLLLGIGIQVSLATAQDLQERRKTAALLGKLETVTAETIRDRREAALAAVAAGKAALAGEPAARAKLWADKHLELLLLVNPWNPVPEGYAPELAEVENPYHQSVYQVDARCAEALTQMMADCRAAGRTPWICSAYRTQEYQQDLFDKKIQRLRWEGVSEADAPEIAAMSVAVPGTSEHQLGLAVDLIDEFYANLDEGQERTETQRWLMENCWRYGFILRYPNGTTDITGIIYEPWHYRYVGEEHAKTITELGVTLEEYVSLRRGR